MRLLFVVPPEDGSSFSGNRDQSQVERTSMKFVSLRRKRAHQRGKLDKPPVVVESFSKPLAVSYEIHTYSELRQQIHDDLRVQHPDWVQPNGECPMCDAYEARLMEELNSFGRTGPDESVADIHRALEHGLNRIKTAPV